jgi:tetratricopeptide (TPR) repeat protein
MRRAAVVLLLAALAAPGTASAAPDPDALVNRAQREMIRLDFQRAIELLERAEATGANRREQLILIYRSLGESHASVGHQREAESDFRRLFALDPDAELPQGSSPKLTAPFAAARQFMQRRASLTVACEPRGESRAVLTVQADPLGQVVAARATRADGSAVPGAGRRTGRDRIVIGLPDGATACSALDRHGNELARASLVTEVRPAPAGPPAEDEDPTSILPPGEVRHEEPPARMQAAARAEPVEADAPPTPSPPLYRRWWAWGGVSAVAAVAGAYFAIQLQSDQDDWRNIKQASDQHTYREAVDVQERGERHALIANVAFGTSAALAAVAVIVGVREARRDKRESSGSSASIDVAPLPGRGAFATLSLSF